LLLTDTVRYIPEIHEVERNLRLLEPLGIHVSGGVLPVLVPGQADRDRVDEVLSHHRADHPRFDYENMIAVAPGSVWNTKRWPKENFIGLIALLVEEGYSIALVGGDDDASLCGEIEDIAGEGAILNAAGRLSLLQSAELLRRCKVAVSNDSAPMHLACAVRTPVVVIFGATVPQFGFGPLGAHDLVVETLGLTCRPCSIHGGDACPIRTFICMKQITPHQVFEKVRSITSRVTIRT
jgi:heptosyltransferase-2